MDEDYRMDWMMRTRGMLAANTSDVDVVPPACKALSLTRRRVRALLLVREFK